LELFGNKYFQQFLAIIWDKYIRSKQPSTLEVFMFWTANAAQAAGRNNSQLILEARREMAQFAKEQKEFLKQQKLLKEQKQEQKP